MSMPITVEQCLGTVKKLLLIRKYVELTRKISDVFIYTSLFSPAEARELPEVDALVHVDAVFLCPDDEFDASFIDCEPGTILHIREAFFSQDEVVLYYTDYKHPEEEGKMRLVWRFLHDAYALYLIDKRINLVKAARKSINRVKPSNRRKFRRILDKMEEILSAMESLAFATTSEGQAGGEDDAGVSLDSEDEEIMRKAEKRLTDILVNGRRTPYSLYADLGFEVTVVPGIKVSFEKPVKVICDEQTRNLIINRFISKKLCGKYVNVVELHEHSVTWYFDKDGILTEMFLLKSISPHTVFILTLLDSQTGFLDKAIEELQRRSRVWLSPKARVMASLVKLLIK